MTWIDAVQSRLPRPDGRDEAQINDDLDDEFNFHLEMRTRELEAEGMDPPTARGFARTRFGDIQTIKSQCKRLALKERIMLQRINFVMMIVVLLAVTAVGVQVMITQSRTTDALNAISTELATLKIAAPDSRRTPASNLVGLVDLSGAVQRAGNYDLPETGFLTLSGLIAASGGVMGDSPHFAQVHRHDGNRIVVRSFDMSKDEGKDFVLQHRDKIVVTDADTVAKGALYFGLPEGYVGAWQHVDAAGSVIDGGATLTLMGREDIRNLRNVPIGHLSLPDRARTFELEFNGAQFPNLGIDQMTPKKYKFSVGRWEYHNDQLLLNISPAVSELTEPLRFVYSGKSDPAPLAMDQRSSVVDEFIDDLFASVKLDDPNPNAAVLKLLDEYEAELDTKYQDDPAKRNMIREGIARRRKDIQQQASITTAMRIQRQEALLEEMERLAASGGSTAGSSSLKELLDQAEALIDRDFKHDPETAAALRQTIDESRKAMNLEPAASQPAPGVTTRPNDDKFPKLSPFREVRWKEWTPFVNLDGTWGELVSINGILVTEIIEHCQKSHAGQERKRFAENLVQVMSEMGKAPGTQVKVQFKDLKTGSLLSIGEVPMTAGNHERVVRANDAADDRTPVWGGEPPPISLP